jgi:hypothetical protein
MHEYDFANTKSCNPQQWNCDFATEYERHFQKNAIQSKLKRMRTSPAKGFPDKFCSALRKYFLSCSTRSTELKYKPRTCSVTLPIPAPQSAGKKSKYSSHVETRCKIKYKNT